MAGLSQRQLADRAGVSKSVVTEAENATRNLSHRNIAKLADALNCPRVILERKRSEPETATPPAGSVPGMQHGERTEPRELQGVRDSADSAHQLTGGGR